MASAGASVGSNMADITPSSGTLNVLGKMQALQQIKQSQANIAETEARTNAIDDNTELKRQELELRRDDLDLQRQLVASQLGLRSVQLGKIKAETKYLEEDKSPSIYTDPVGYVKRYGSQLASWYSGQVDAWRADIRKNLEKGGR